MAEDRRDRTSDCESGSEIDTTEELKERLGRYKYVLPGQERNLNWYSRICHQANFSWWIDPLTGVELERNKGELLMLIVSEIAEAMEGERKGLMDDKLPRRKMAEVELADALIRIFDYAGAFGLDLEGAWAEKMEYNSRREDHKPENRLKDGGKKW